MDRVKPRSDANSTNANDEFALSLRGLRKSFEDGRVVIDDLSLDLTHGEILVLCGPSGCGKTTTLRLAAGFIRPDAGSVYVEGLEVAGTTWVPPERRPVGVVFQDYALFPHLTVERNVAFGLTHIQKEEKTRTVAQRLRLVGLEGFESRYPHELSGGEQQRVALARALAPNPKVVLLDEPFSNLDAFLRVKVRGETRQILKNAGTTAIFVTHDQEEALALADRLVVLNRGRLEQIGTPEEVYHTPATAFVANFMGEANFLPGTVEADGICTELGRWPARPKLSRGDEVEVMFRPHDISLKADPTSLFTVSSRQFLGEINLYSVALPSGREVLSSSSAHTIFNPGDKVQITFAPDRGVVFINGKAAPMASVATSPQGM